MAGRWTPQSEPTEPVTFSWESAGSSHGAMHTTLGPGGERFRGSFVRVTSEAKSELVTSVYSAWGSGVWNTVEWGPGWGGEEVTYAGFVKQYSGQVVATLFGDKGDSMRCRFTVSEPLQGLVAGGVGQCQVSNGGKIDVEF